MTNFDPYHQWLGIPAHEQPAHHYRLLAISLFESNDDVIDMAADRQMRFLAQIVAGPNVKEAQRLLNELSAARICLLNPAKKAEYDAKLKTELATGNPVAAPEKSASPSSTETKKKPPTPSGSLRKQAEKLLAEHEYGRAQQVLQEMMASTVATEQPNAAWAKQQIVKAKTGDENMRKQAESAIQYSRKLIDTHEYADAIQLLEQFPPKFRNAKLTSLLEEATRLQQEVDLLQVDISQFMAQRNFVELKAAVQRFRELKPANAKMKQLWADLNTYGNKPVVFLEPDERKAHKLSTAGGITTGQMIAGAAIVSLLFGATLYATYYYVGNSKKGVEKTVAPAEESTWKVEIQIDNPAANVTIDGQPVKLTGKLTSIYLLPGRHEWTATLSAGESKSGQFELRKMETQSLVITMGQPAAPTSESLNMPWNTSEFQAWMKEVSTMAAEQQVTAVIKRLQELNPDFDGKATHHIENGNVSTLEFNTKNIKNVAPVRALTGLQILYVEGGDVQGQLSDLAPLSGMKLEELKCSMNPISNLSALRGMPLNSLIFYNTNVSDLSAFKGMHSTSLDLSGTPVTDLSPLRGMPLTYLGFAVTKVADLTPLVGMPLERLSFPDTEVTDLTPLKEMKLSELIISPSAINKGVDQIRQMRSLATIGTSWKERLPAAEFWKKYDAGEFGKTNPSPSELPLEPWMKEIAALPVENQVDAVSKKLKELNPEFDGKVTHQIENGAVTMLGFNTDHVKNIAPVRALTRLQILEVTGSEVNYASQGQLSDLSPLTGMKLRSLNCSLNPISTLLPLQGMKLDELRCFSTNIADLTPLKGMPLASLSCYRTNVSDLSPLRGLPLASLGIGGTPVLDLLPIQGMPLMSLDLRLTEINDLKPLVGMPLSKLSCDKTDVTDLTPLKGMELTELTLTPSSISKGLDHVREIKSLTKIGTGWLASEQWPPAEFWKRYDAGEFKAPDRKPVTSINDPAFQKWLRGVVTQSAKKQLESVAKKLQELNPGFDGKLTPKIENGVITELELLTDNVSDIAPVRALPKLTSLKAIGSDKSGRNLGKLENLTPLNGAKLKILSCGWNPLKDLSPLDGMPLKDLSIQLTKVSDLSALRKTKLRLLDISITRVSDISSLNGMPLEYLWMQQTKVRDLRPVAGMPLIFFDCHQTNVTDLTPLKDAKLTWLMVTPSKITKGMDIIRQMKGIEKIWTSHQANDQLSATDFWRKYDAGEFAK